MNAATQTCFMNSTTPIQQAYDEQGNPNYLREGQLLEGIYIGLENNVYHELPAISSSQIKTYITKGAAHYYRKYLSNIETTRTKNLAQERTLDTGTIIHELILEGTGFYDRYYRLPLEKDYPDALITQKELVLACEKHQVDVPKSATKPVLAEALKSANAPVTIFDDVIKNIEDDPYNEDKTGLDGMVWDNAHRAYKTFEEHPTASAFISNGLAEVTFIAKCQITGLMLKCRFDWLRFDNHAVDVKSTRSTSINDFVRQAGSLGYHYQEAFYTYVASLLNVDLEDFIFLCVEYLEADITEIIRVRNKERAFTKTLRALKDLHARLHADDFVTGVSSGGVVEVDIPEYY
ncbi:PD-(D/E)XK nuclease-like domain-containing protein [Vibrio maritimus]|jgi:exodeoxyribonuclease VIII|uniref:PD-(D/E)XK nuclease-like domain-containing protein n=1 Tax=Vibrio maritimus TaxID=990268 RepID=UPI004067D296